MSAEPLTATSDWASELAKQLIASKSPPSTELDDAQLLALAWALKDAAIGAWSSAPTEVAIAAEALGALQSIADSRAAPEDAEVRAIASWVKGIADLTRGKMTDAITHLDDATERFRALGQQGHAAHAQVPKIMALSMLGQHRQAAESGLATQNELLEQGDLYVAAKVSLNLGHLYCRLNDYVAALRHFLQAESFFDNVGDHERSISCQLGAAEAYSSVGDFEGALSLYSRAKQKAEDCGFSALLGLAVEAVALVHLARGEYRDALSGLEDCRRRYESLGMSQNAAMAEKQLADAYFDLRLLPEALSLFDQSLARCEALEMPVEEAWAHVQRGRTLAAMNRPSKEISDSLLCAAKLFSSQEIPSGQATVWLARAELALANHEYDAASKFAEDAANLFADVNLPTGTAQARVISAQALLFSDNIAAAKALFSTTLANSRELRLVTVQVRCLVGLGLAAQTAADVDTARDAFQSAITLFEEQRSALPGDDLRSAFLIDQLRPYEELLRIALDAHDRQPQVENANQVFVNLDRFRARALGERLGELKGHVAPHSDPDQALRTHLNWLYRRTQKLIDEGEDVHSVTEESRRLEHELLENARRRRLTVRTENSAPLSDATVLNAHALVTALNEDEAIVEYGVLDDELFACVVTSDDVMVVRNISRWTDVTEAVRNARFQLETLRYGTGSMDRHGDLLTRRSKAAMKRLYDLVWAALPVALSEKKKILIVPHEQLGAVQFAALFDAEHYLAEKFEFAVAPSAQIALRGLARLPVAPTRAVVLADTTRLQHAANEARLVASLFVDSKVLIGDDANASVLREWSGHADVLHLACHGQFRSDNPMFSALHFADSPFTVADAEMLTLKQGVVVLSACETGIAHYSRGDEMMGLVRGFLVAGASRVLASLWPVDDEVTLQFMSAFYRSLCDGNSPSFALRTAQLDVMRTRPHPFHWAAFTLYGGW